MDDARHLAKYVFARQYGLASPFRFQTPKREAFKLPNFDNREHEIKGNFKTPKRLREIIPFLEKLIWRHGKCAYKLLRDHACPSKVKALRREDVDSSGILVRVSCSPTPIPRRSHDGGYRKLISEHPSSASSWAPRTQKSFATEISIDSEGNSVLPAGLTQAAMNAKTKPRFVEYSCSHIEVRSLHWVVES
ncbi:hypothetical protein B0H11DRAFT_252152 [Mycena galericulata]|nr:hypothetical protein B0H11DRAFT_252152 [Mycena galericulata]